MAVGTSQPTVVATKDGRIGMKNQMQVTNGKLNFLMTSQSQFVNSYTGNMQYVQVNVTADHRVIYGADLASFLQTLANIIEDPKDLTFQFHIHCQMAFQASNYHPPSIHQRLVVVAQAHGEKFRSQSLCSKTGAEF